MDQRANTLDLVDVVVVGAGSAGVCAALAAARMGSKVMLIERSQQLGGMGSLAFVHTFCGLYMPDISEPPKLANRGLPEEIEKAMRERTQQSGPVKMGRVYVLPQQPDVFDCLLKELVAGESEYLDLLLNTECLSVSRDEEGLFVVGISSARGKQTVRCRSLIDCSADALLADYLGATRERVEPERIQRPAFIFALRNVGEEASTEGFKMRLALDIVHAVRAGELPSIAMGTSIRQSPSQGEYFVSLDLETSEGTWDPSDVGNRGEIREVGEQLAQSLRRFFQGKYHCFKDVSEPRFAPEIGVRESYRWSGEYTLTEDDLLEGKAFKDTVAYATWPVELREDAKGPKFKFPKTSKVPQIPLRSLTSNEIPGVYFAGRCLSATHESLASVRVMGTCFATGQAAGMAAAMYSEGVTDRVVQVDRIQKKLKIVSNHIEPVHPPK
ncbi:FAD-dependent oxidoreductase [Rubritalea sp.]|uniref:FAD-dependent oxidoreductase n=1 Tax=Rubritalea sp. TaxID=2109375 RepID=UPI003EF58CC0